MKVPKLRFCHTCGRHCRNMIYQFEGRDYCERHWRDRLDWDERRGQVVSQIRSLLEFQQAVGRVNGQEFEQRPDWLPYIRDLCGLAEFGLVQGDRKIFVRYFALAVSAWGMRGDAE